MDTNEIREAISQEDELNHINDTLDYLYEIRHNIMRGLVNEALIDTENLISKVEERKQLKSKRKELNETVTGNV